MLIVLSNEEILGAVIVGSRRLMVSLKKGLAPAAEASRSWNDEIEGALGESAFARATGLFFDPRLGRYGTPDVGMFHIRQTTLPEGCLIIRPKDTDGVYALVVGSLGTYKLAGTITAERARAMSDCIKGPQDRPSAWFIPQDRLDPWPEE